MQEITVTIKWDKPDEPYWLNADNIKTALSSYCKNTSFEVEASRDSKSAVPNEDEIEKWYIEKYGIARDLNGKPSWNSQSIGYRTDGDLYEMLNDFAKWIKQRGIAG